METIKIEIEHSNKDYKILKITALTNSHICALNKDKVGYLEFLEEFDCQIKNNDRI